MLVKTITEPVLLYETLGMVCKYYRKESYSETAETMISKYASVLSESQMGELRTNAAIADQFMNEVCSDLKCASNDVKFFFEPFETGDEDERNCVARVLILSMMGLDKTDFDEAIQETKRRWSEAKAEGMEVLEFNMHGLSFISAKDRTVTSLFEQIYAQDYPHKVKMDVFRALEKHEYYIDKLADILRPYARRMNAARSRLFPIYAITAENWAQYLRDMPSEQVFEILRIDKKTQINMITQAAVSLFLFNEIGRCLDDIPSSPNELTTLYIGVAVYPDYAIAKADRQLERLSEIIKALADPARIAILARLMKQPDYCLNIAQTMNLNAGNVSRHLTMLHEYGLLTREKREGRIYFDINIDAIKNTFDSYLDYIIS